MNDRFQRIEHSQIGLVIGDWFSKLEFFLYKSLLLTLLFSNFISEHVCKLACG